jgi:hypothetical protein
MAPGASALDSDSDWRVLDTAAMTTIQLGQKEQAVKAKDGLATTLLGELEEALESHGPAGAVEVCRTTAPSLSAEVAQNHGVAIGRTSFRLRNPANAPPAWARPAVTDRLPDPVYMVGPEGELGVLFPIRVKAGCTMCHGIPEQLSDEAVAAVRKLYPDDQAVGFGEGDLRGWFWVEVPPGEESL